MTTILCYVNNAQAMFFFYIVIIPNEYFKRYVLHIYAQNENEGTKVSLKKRIFTGIMNQCYKKQGNDEFT